jgi:hypothetical protein
LVLINFFSLILALSAAMDTRSAVLGHPDERDGTVARRELGTRKSSVWEVAIETRYSFMIPGVVA